MTDDASTGADRDVARGTEVDGRDTGVTELAAAGERKAVAGGTVADAVDSIHGYRATADGGDPGVEVRTDER